MGPTLGKIKIRFENHAVILHLPYIKNIFLQIFYKMKTVLNAFALILLSINKIYCGIISSILSEKQDHFRELKFAERIFACFPENSDTCSKANEFSLAKNVSTSCYLEVIWFS